MLLFQGELLWVQHHDVTLDHVSSRDFDFDFELPAKHPFEEIPAAYSDAGADERVMQLLWRERPPIEAHPDFKLFRPGSPSVAFIMESFLFTGIEDPERVIERDDIVDELGDDRHEHRAVDGTLEESR